MELRNRVAMVTGANRGIGAALVAELLQRGVRSVYATARDVGQLSDLSDPRVTHVRLDITQEEQVQAAARQAHDTDLLINNAGVLTWGSVLTASAEDLRRDMEVNYFGTLRMIRAFAPVLEKNRQPVLANVASIAAFANFPMQGGYCASKAALFSVTQGVRIELAGRGVTVLSINPGPIDTDMTRSMAADKTSAAQTAAGVLDGIESGEADIFPDPIGAQMFAQYRADYRNLEQIAREFTEALQP